MEIAGRIGEALGADHDAHGFLTALAGRAVPQAAKGERPSGKERGAEEDAEEQPVDRLARGLGLGPAETDVLLLAGLADEHEGLSSVLRELHPGRVPAATTGLAAVLAEAGALTGAPSDPLTARLWLRRLLRGGPLVASGAVRPQGGGPFWDRTLDLAEGLWDALHAAPLWPAGTRRTDPALIGLVPPGLRAENPAVAAVLRAVGRGVPATVVLRSDDPADAALRIAALLTATGREPAVLDVPVLDRSAARAVALVALAHGVTPVLVAQELPDGAAALDDVPAPAVLAPPPGAALGATSRPLLSVDVPPPPLAAHRELWRRLAPDLPGTADTVPCTLGAAAAQELARNATAGALIRGEPLRPADLRAALDARETDRTPQGVVRLRPTAGWDGLVLPPDRLAQLREAVNQVRRQHVVLDRWGFLRGRPGRRGVRLLFYGPPGTGKTLAAEVLAGAVGRELLVVDLSRIVSKWIGETEKNLAEAFDAAERGDALILFDEADTLFGRRTEVGDARDRYANLETAYLLSRLACFDGLAVLATNLRQNIDQAFARRLEFIVPFDLPGEAERRTLWRHNLPSGAPLDARVDLGQLAALYPLSGSLIRNAAVAAAYFAAEAGTAIGPEHLALAVRREYAKAGQAYPGDPPGAADAEPLRADAHTVKESPCP
ncbi:ATP-binding protein [Streptomyces tagetis]|uniref:ATP-binding protein n=1 Tax=Streptomyces tagetis TaxID=2820809 RepID=A0A941B1Y6_9ACTN|nr:ATP-binding protein [Streptomyces sp. RG38]MBQ0826647.1 ATP-binding protein [Streptomyces sp. RG38]